MLNFGTFFLWALAVFTLWRGSLAEDVQSQYVCLLDDPYPNQCDSFCLTELRPLLNQVLRGQDQGRETNAKLDRLEAQQDTLEGQLQGVRAKLEGRLHEVQTKLQGVEAKLEGQQAVLTRMAESLAKLEGNLPAVQTSLESKLQAVLNQLQGASTTTEANVNIPSGFEKIGTRYFKIVEERVDWITAVRKCREMGGYLAAFRNVDEINAITEKLEEGEEYWLGLNDREIEGRFVSLASHKLAQFFTWGEEQPDNYKTDENCVNLLDGEMWDDRCYDTYYFICQADNET